MKLFTYIISILITLFVIFWLVARERVIMNEHEFEQLKRTVEEQGRQIEELKSIPLFRFPLNDEQLRAIEYALDNILPKKLPSYFINNFYYSTSQFESLDGWSVTSGGGGGTATVNDTGVTLTTSATSGSIVGITKGAVAQPTYGLFTMNGFRVSVEFQIGSLSSSEAGFALGGDYSDINNNYGFFTSNNTLKAFAADSVNRTEITLPVVLNQLQTYVLCAIYIFGEKVLFYVDGVKVGEIKDTIPERGAVDTYHYSIKTMNNTAKTMILGSHESFHTLVPNPL